MTKRPRAATLAVGTEVTDGQIIDRNSAWISARLVEAGVQVIEHRAVADDRADIERALRELSLRCDHLFVTGGLGPTSDDFTRDLIALVFDRPLEFDPGSWEHLSQLLTSRGMQVREIQKQQCYFPRGSRVLTNPAGTANAFAFQAGALSVYALPGPPTEIAAVWASSLAAEVASWIPEAEREKLSILRLLGRGESQVAEVVEEIIRGTSLRVGYRAHVPYVEVKLWYRPAEAASHGKAMAAIENALKTWLINRDDEDVTDAWITASRARKIRVVDGATGGLLQARLSERATGGVCHLRLETRCDGDLTGWDQGIAPGEVAFALAAEGESWKIRVKTGEGRETLLEEKPVYNYKVLSERGRKYITEKTLLVARSFL